MFEESTLKRNSLPSTVTGEIVWHLIEISPDHFAKLSLPARLPFNSEMRSVGRVSSFGSVLVRQPPQKNSYFTRALKRSIQAFIIYTSSSKLSNNRNCLFPISTHNLILVQKWMQMSQCSVTINSTFNGFSVSDPLLLKAARNMESPWFDLGHPKAAVKRNCNAGGGRMQRTFLKPVTGGLWHYWPGGRARAHCSSPSNFAGRDEGTWKMDHFRAISNELSFQRWIDGLRRWPFFWRTFLW